MKWSPQMKPDQYIAISYECIGEVELSEMTLIKQ
jgi:hypothetical protein